MAHASALRSLFERPPEKRRLGPFHLIKQLGKGGFAPVWVASEVYGDVEIRRVAVKLFALGGAADDVRGGTERRLWRERVIEEARLLCQVEHPNIVRFYRLLVDEEPGMIGLVMEHIDGLSLERRLDDKGTLSIDEALAVGAAVASALSAVHRAGLIHRDIKPSNIVEADGVTKLIDFGIASTHQRPSGRPKSGPRIRMDDLPAEVLGTNMSLLSSKTSSDATGSGESDAYALPSGTIGYIDPVCVTDAAPAVPASDLYALGATLFECLTGKLPSVIAAGPDGGMKGEVLDGRAHAPRLADVATDVPPGLARLVDALLDPDRDKRPASAERVAIEIERLRSERAGRPRHMPPEEIGPFRGLNRFEQADRDVYFGRSVEVAAALEMLKSRGMVALIGPSGSGKSSLARAGIVPAVADGALGGWIKQWEVRVTVPGADPRGAIEAALADLVPDAGKLRPDALVSVLAARAEADATGILLVVDQLEELVTVAGGESRNWAADLLARVAEPMTPGVRALVAARRDLLDPLLSLGSFGHVLQRGFLLVTPISRATWREVTGQAIAAYGYTFEDDALRDELMGELGGTEAAMPLIQFALTELWEHRDKTHKKITRAGLREIGGIAGALEKHAESTWEKLVAKNGLAAAHTAHELLLSLTTPQGTRAVQPLQALAPTAQARSVVEHFEDARLLVRQEGGLTLAHEALLTQWPRLRGWLAEAHEDRVLAEEIERDAVLWQRDKDASLLWKKRRLAAADDLSRRALVKLSAPAWEFVKRSIAEERQGKTLVVLGAVAMLLAVAVGIVKYVTDMQRERRIAEENAIEASIKEQQAIEQKKIADEQRQIANQERDKTEAERRRVARIKDQFEHDLVVLSKAVEEAVEKRKSLEELEDVKKQLDTKRDLLRNLGPPPPPMWVTPSRENIDIMELMQQKPPPNSRNDPKGGEAQDDPDIQP